MQIMAKEGLTHLMLLLWLQLPGLMIVHCVGKGLKGSKGR